MCVFYSRIFCSRCNRTQTTALLLSSLCFTGARVFSTPQLQQVHPFAHQGGTQWAIPRACVSMRHAITVCQANTPDAKKKKKALFEP